jgi:anaerobic magnesium-protoporphyrin IX monomethyl ester cyclase
MRVVLVNPYVLAEDEREARTFHPYAPMGPLYVAARLEADGHEVEFFDATFEPNINNIVSTVSVSKADVVGVYATFLSHDNALRVGRAAREMGAFAVVGGPDANVELEAYLEEAFDAVVLGEGETTTSELVTALEADKDWKVVPGLAWMGDRGVVEGDPRERIGDLDSIAFPARHLVDMEGYARRWRARHGYFALSIMSSRGCPYRCAFCSRPVFGKSVKRRSVANVVEELTELKQRYGADRVRFADDILPMDKEWMMDLCHRIKEADLSLEFECLARADLMDGEILNAMADAGFKEVFYGVESGSDAVLEKMCKGQTRELVQRAATQTRDAGMVQHWFVMFGYPGETLEDIESTIDMVLDVGPESISMTVAYPIRGTPLHEEVQEVLTSGKWTQSDDVEMMFHNRYPRRFYRWTVFRVNASLRLRRLVGRRDSSLLRAFDAFARTIAKVLAVEDESWS